MNSQDLPASRNQQSTLPSIFTLNYLSYGLSVHILLYIILYTHIAPCNMFMFNSK